MPNNVPENHTGESDEFLILSIRAALEAGAAIQAVYQTDFNVEYKDDCSPLTLADRS